MGVLVFNYFTQMKKMLITLLTMIAFMLVTHDLSAHKYFGYVDGNPDCVAWDCGNDNNCCLPEIVIIGSRSKN